MGAEKMLSEIAAAKSSDPAPRGDGFHCVIRWYAIDLMLEGRTAAVKRLMPMLPTPYRDVFVERRKSVEQILDARKDRFQYPTYRGNIHFINVLRMANKQYYRRTEIRRRTAVDERLVP